MTLSLRRQVFAFLRPYRTVFGFALAQVVLIGGAELLKPWPLKLIIDNVLGGQRLLWPLMAGWSRETLLVAACVGLVVVYIMLGALHLLNNHTTIRIGQNMVNDLRSALYNHLQRLSLAFHNRRQVGDLLYRVTADTYSIQTLTMNGIFSIATSLVLLVGMTLVMLRLDWLLTLLAVGVCPLLFVTISTMSTRINQAATAAHERESAIYTLVQRTMSAIRVIQAFTKEEEEHRRFMAASTESLSASLRLYNLQALYSGAVNVVIALGTALVVWVGARHALAGTLSVGELVVFTTYLASLYGPINTISQTLGLIEGGKAGFVRVHEILAVERDLPEGNRIAAETGIRGEIVFENVTFGYTPGQPVLRGVNLHVTPGQTVAIVGPSGAGKSTLVSLLPQGYDTVVGEQGATLSEGERQRLTIARALVRDAPILILDEPTSSVDAETEALIMAGFERLMTGRTTFRARKPINATFPA